MCKTDIKLDQTWINHLDGMADEVMAKSTL